MIGQARYSSNRTGKAVIGQVREALIGQARYSSVRTGQV